MIGQSQPQYKGKISRVLAAKCALAIRVDALGDTTDAAVGTEARAKVEARLRQLEGRSLATDAGRAKGKAQPAPYSATKQQAAGTGLAAGAAKAYNADADVVPAAAAPAGDEKKEKKEKKDKKDKKDKKQDKVAAEVNGAADNEGKKKKKRKAEGEGEDGAAAAADGEVRLV